MAFRKIKYIREQLSDFVEGAFIYFLEQCILQLSN